MSRTALRRALPTVAAFALGITALTGCSTGSNQEKAAEAPAGASSGTTTGAESGAFPVSVKHRFGTTEIEDAPQRVVTLGSLDQDNALALGVVPVGVPKLTWGQNENNSSDWFDAALADLGGEAPAQIDTTDSIPTDEIAALQPDLILATNSGLTQEQYETLSKVADVVPPPGADWLTSWDDSLELAGQALGLPAKAAEVEQATEALIDGVENAHPQLDGTSFLFTYFAPEDRGSVGVYAEGDPRVNILEEFGLEVPDLVEAIVPEGSFYGDVSAEKADTLKSDLLLTYFDSDEHRKGVLGDPLLKRIPALASGNYVALANDGLGLAITSPTPLSIPVVIDELVPQIAAKAN